MGEFRIKKYGKIGNTTKEFKYKCPICGEISWIEMRTLKKKKDDPRCTSCLRSDHCKKWSTDRWKNLTQDERDRSIDILHKGVKKYRDNISDEERKRVRSLKSKSTSMQMKARWANDEYRKKRGEVVREEMIDRWKNGAFDHVVKSLHVGRDNYFANASEEQKAERSSKISKALTGKPSAYWSTLSDEERESVSKERSDRMKKFWESVDDTRYEEYIKKKRQSATIYWDTLSEEEKAQKIKKALSSPHLRNDFHIRFEKAFEESHLANNFYYVSEYVTNNNDTIHSWDYGIFNNDGKLVVLVDLDGAFYHGDLYDYNGVHSREELDERRGLSIPEGVSHIIIYETNFSKCFKLLMKTIWVDYDTFISDTFKSLRNMPFPHPKYSNSELLQSYDKLAKFNCDSKYYSNISLNCRLGDRLITHFHESIYYAKRGNDVSPYDAWHDDKLLMEVIKNRVLYQNYLNPNKILQGFNISRIAMKVSVFSAARAKLIIYKYLNEFNKVFDPFSGFSGRMLGCISLGKRYIGQDISPIHVRESNDILEFLDKYGIEFDASVEVGNVLESKGKYDCLFTCPPYSDKEVWLDVPVSIYTCDDWIDICMKRFKCKRYVFVVDSTTKYKDCIVDTITNRSHLSTNQEFVISIGGIS